MSKRSASVVINDILSCIDHIQLYTANITFDELTANFMILEACLYNIQIIGEAVAQLDDQIKTDNPQIPWALIKGMRNRLIHQYFGTDLPTVWNVIKEDLPLIKTEFERILDALG